MLVVPSPHGTRTTDPGMDVKWGMWTRTAGGGASHLPLEESRAIHRRSQALALHQLAEQPGEFRHPQLELGRHELVPHQLEEQQGNPTTHNWN